MILNVPKTEKTPEIILDDGQQVLQIKGNCLPENIRNLSEMVTEKLEKYLSARSQNEPEEAGSKPFRVFFKLGYFNTAAAKFIADILLVVKTDTQRGGQNRIYWHYHEDDRDMLEAGEDMANMVEVPMQYVMTVKE
jgi:hypothetical protein